MSKTCPQCGREASMLHKIAKGPMMYSCPLWHSWAA